MHLALHRELFRLQLIIWRQGLTLSLLRMRLGVLRAALATSEAIGRITLVVRPAEKDQAWSDVVREADRIVNRRDGK
jgi:hypothetical protein